MKILAIVASLLGVAFIGVFVWAFLTTNELNETREILSSTIAELSATTTELKETKGRLSDTTEELTDTRNDLENTEDELTSTRDELGDIKSELSIAVSELSSARTSLTSAESDLADTQGQLDIAQGTLEGLGITLMASKECYDVDLTDNPQAINPTWEQLKAFLSEDKTDTNRYIIDEYDCSEFSRDVHNNAEATGIRAAEVQVWWSNKDAGHALNAFLTTDYGLVYIDCTGSPDITTRVIVGKTYRGVDLRSASPANLRNNGWWENLSAYYYIPASSGGQAKTASIKIYW
ncbi:hypothetical protein ACFLTB_00230 [Chloroflexota bacterium]